MSLKGRKPKHPGLELLDGGRGKRAKKRSVVEVPTDYPPMPKGFEHPELWVQVQTIFEENGTPIRSSDVFAIEDLCSLLGTVRYLQRMVSSGNHTTQGERLGSTKANPMVAELKSVRDQLWRAFDRFGMTPVDASRLPLRSKVKTPREKVMEGWDAG